MRVGNVYVNRNMIGAVVGVQPFGGEGLSGTGPKAGGPHYLFRFAVERTLTVNTAAAGGNAALLAQGEALASCAALAPLDPDADLPARRRSAQLGDAHLDPRRAEFVAARDLRDALGEALEQLVRMVAASACSRATTAA